MDSLAARLRAIEHARTPTVYGVIYDDEPADVVHVAGTGETMTRTAFERRYNPRGRLIVVACADAGMR